MQVEKLRDLVVEALVAMKGEDIRVLDVRNNTAITDYMVVVSGNSDRHVKALANSAQAAAGEQGVKAIGVEGDSECEWILVDLCDVVVHVMLPRVRDFYNLEKLWDVAGGAAEDAEATMHAKLKR